jgi:hypothetical protein
MKKTLIVLCSAIALVGCNQNRGGLGDNTSRDTGSSSSRNTTYPSTDSSINSPSTAATNTNGILPAPAEPAPTKQNQGGTDATPKN